MFDDPYVDEKVFDSNGKLVFKRERGRDHE